jgi:hypothetical protein
LKLNTAFPWQLPFPFAIMLSLVSISPPNGHAVLMIVRLILDYHLHFPLGCHVRTSKTEYIDRSRLLPQLWSITNPTWDPCGTYATPVPQQ